MRRGGPAVTLKGTPSQVSSSAASFSSRHEAAVQVSNIWHWVIPAQGTGTQGDGRVCCVLPAAPWVQAA